MIITHCGWVILFGCCAALHPVKDMSSVRAAARNIPALSAGTMIQHFSSLHWLNSTPAQSPFTLLLTQTTGRSEGRCWSVWVYSLTFRHIFVSEPGDTVKVTDRNRSGIIQRVMLITRRSCPEKNDPEWAETLQHQRLLYTCTDGHGWVSVAEMQQETASLHHSGHTRVFRSVAAKCGTSPRFSQFLRRNSAFRKLQMNKLIK